jgi:hypothetical protein
MSSENLTIEELAYFQDFLKERNISNAKLARFFGKKPTTASYWFKVGRMDRLRVREFVKQEELKTLEAFEKVKQI